MAQEFYRILPSLLTFEVRTKDGIKFKCTHNADVPISEGMEVISMPVGFKLIVDLKNGYLKLRPQ